MTTPSLHLDLLKVEFDYEAQTPDELTVTEDQLVWVLEDDDPEWFKVKIKSTSPSPAIGLVPASYLTSPTPLRSVRAVYDYVPTRNDAGELENEEELEITEGEELQLWEDEGDWVLVGREGAKGVGFVPGSYVEADGGEAEEEQYEEAAAPAVAYVDPSERVAAAKAAAKPGDVKTWGEIDKKKKKKKGTLGVGNGAVFFASESDKTPVQQYPISTLTDLTTEKSKHLHLTFPTCGELHFVINSKSDFDDIVAKIEEGRTPASPAASPLPSPSTETPYIPPPPPLAHRRLPPASTAVSPPPPSPPRPTANGANGNAVALYDFEPDGADELRVAEGDRLILIKGGSDDPDWVKVRKVGSTEEGVVPATYVQRDDGDDEDEGETAEEEEVRLAEEVAAAEDAAALAAHLRADKAKSSAQAKLAADRELKEQQRKKEAAAESARRKRLSTAPPAAPIPIPQPGEEPPRIATRPSRESREAAASAGKSGLSGRTKEASKKPAAHRVRTWKDRTGQFKVDAEFLGLNGNKIRLHKLNGVIIEVPIEKMSSEDTAYLKKVTSRSASGDDDTPLAHIANQEDRRNERHRRGEAAAEGAGAPRQSSRPPASKPAKPRQDTDWFEFFLNAGCDMNDCTRYANNFQRERIEESLVSDLEATTLRTLGLREGDIIRVLKLVRDKYGAPPTPDKSDRDAQISADAQMARSLQGPTPPPPNLFTGPDGGLKSTRRGRPANGRQATAVDSAALADAGAALAKRSETPPVALPSNRTGSSLDPSRRSSSTIPQLGGFDDDAWTVKTPSKPTTPVPPPIQAPVASPQPPAPTPIQPPIQQARPGSTGPPTSTLSYNDGLLAQLGIGARPPSAPVPHTYSQGMSPNGSYSGQSPGSFIPSGPRAPIAPIPANQGLLAPLIPTNTGMPSFGRSPFSQGPMMPQATGFPMQQGMGMQQPLTQSFTGMPMQSPFGNQMQMQPTGSPSYLQSQPTGFLQQQPTGFQPNYQQQQQQQQQPSFNALPSRFSPAPPMPPIQFNPAPPPRVSAPPASSTTAQFQPSNIFSSMKDGSFAKGSQLGPQDPTKYDALRPQPTGMPAFSPQGGFQQPGLQPQQTGFPGMMQPQMTGFQPPGQVFPQQTGMPQYGQNGYQQRQF